jgi:hypothetical protein
MKNGSKKGKKASGMKGRKGSIKTRNWEKVNNIK